MLVPVIASKQTGYEDALAALAAEAILSTMPPADKPASVTVDNVRTCKIVGGSPLDSQVVRGVVVQRDTDGSVKHVEKAKIAVFACSIEASSSETKGVVVIKSPEELMEYNKGEERLMEETIKGIADAGARVVIAGGSISEIALHFLEKYGLMAVRIPSKFELRRLCKAVGAAQLVRVGAPSAAEMGYADVVSVQELSSRLVTVFRQLEGEDSGISTIVLRGATMNMLDDMERAVDDAVHTARQLCKDARLVPGGGAVEMELAHRLHAAADACKGLEMYSMHKFAESRACWGGGRRRGGASPFPFCCRALHPQRSRTLTHTRCTPPSPPNSFNPLAVEVVPRTLAENSGQVSTDIIAALYAAHAAGKAGEGVNVEGVSGTGGTKDCQAAGILDCLAVKHSALRLAAETAITVLRVDQIIMSKQVRGGSRARLGPARARASAARGFPHAFHTNIATHRTLCPAPPRPSLLTFVQAGGPNPKQPGQSGDDD